MAEQLEIFFNTMNCTGKELKERSFRAGAQNARILDYFRSRPGALMTPVEVRHNLGMFNTPLTSVRRSMTTLTNFNYLQKTNFKKQGDFGADNYCWKLKTE